jgi:hypothetical protein
MAQADGQPISTPGPWSVVNVEAVTNKGVIGTVTLYQRKYSPQISQFQFRGRVDSSLIRKTPDTRVGFEIPRPTSLTVR